MTLMPDEQMGDAVQPDGQRQLQQRIDLGGVAGVEPGEGHYHVGVHPHPQRCLEGGHGCLDTPVEILLCQLVIQHPAVPPLAVSLHMGITEVVLQIPVGLSQRRVVLLHQTSEVIDRQHSLTDAVGQGIEPIIGADAVLPHREGDVHLSLTHLGQTVLGPLLVTQADPWCLPFQLAQVERGKQGKGAVHAGDDELSLRAGGVELGRLDQVIQRQQDGLQLLLQCKGTAGGLQPVGRADKEGIIEGIAQTAEGFADGGLAQMQAACRLAAVALFQQHLQDNQQIEVDATQLFQQHDMNPLQF